MLSGHVERVTRRQIMRVRVDGTSSEGSALNTLDLTPPEVDVTKATIHAWPAKNDGIASARLADALQAGSM